jgi:outer membrane protein assembly factor BamB
VVSILLLTSLVAVGDWPQSRRDARNSAFVELPAATLPRTWTFDGSPRVWGYRPGMSVWTSPALGAIGDDPVLVIGSYDHNVYCLDAATGELRWKVSTGDGVYAGPVLWNDTAYVTSSDRLLYAFDLDTGALRWSHSVESFRPTLGGARLSSPTIGRVETRPAVFFGHWVWDRSLSQSMQEGGISALDATSGEVLWRAPLGDNELTAPVYFEGAGGRWLYVGSSTGNLFALAADTGQVLWTQTELDAVRGAPAVADGPAGPRVVMASKYGTVRCLNASDGHELWRYKTGDWVTAAPVVAPILGRELVLVGSYDRSLYGLDLLTGTLVWRYFGRGGFYSAAALAPMGGRPLVLASAWDHRLHAIEGRNGAEAWTVYTGRPLWSAVGLEHSNWASPAVARLGDRWMAYAGSYDGTLYAFPLSDMAVLRAKRERSNLGFWISFPIALTCAGVFAVALTRWHRRQKRGPSIPG